MRRAEKEITNRAEIDEIMKRGRVCHLGLCDSGIPYVVPVNYGYADGSLYVHSAREGKKIEILRSNNLVSFNVCVDECLKESDAACDWTMKYRSVTGVGKACLLDNRADKSEALRLIMSHYSDAEYQFDPAMVDRVLIIKIRVDKLTGKKAV